MTYLMILLAGAFVSTAALANGPTTKPTKSPAASCCPNGACCPGACCSK